MEIVPTKKKNWVLTQESFDRLLVWLDPDPHSAGKKYEQIRQRLIKIFITRGCINSEELADETINRVTRKLQEMGDTYVGEPTPYFYSVARLVYLEQLKKPPAVAPPPPVQEDEEETAEYECLEHCLQKLTADNRDLILSYYQEEKGAKIENRKRLADRLGIAPNALRIRATRIRASLEDCIRECLQRKP